MRNGAAELIVVVSFGGWRMTIAEVLVDGNRMLIFDRRLTLSLFSVFDLSDVLLAYTFLYFTSFARHIVNIPVRITVGYW